MSFYSYNSLYHSQYNSNDPDQKILVYTTGGASDPHPDSQHDKVVEKAAVACDVPICSTMGTDILKRGGSAVDAAVTVALCIGSVNSFSSGIGGGGFMTVRHSNGSALAFNFRETAPELASKHMYKNDPMDAQIGGLAVGVPGELAGLYQAFLRYGSGNLTWYDLFEPVIELNTRGFRVEEPLAFAVDKIGPRLVKDSDDWPWLFKRSFFGKKRLVQLGDTVRRPALAKTLTAIGRNNSDALFYDPQEWIVKALVDKIASTGGIVQPSDFANYSVLIEKPLETTFRGRQVLTTPNPTSGPALIFGLNVMEGFTTDVGGDFSSIATQRLVETMKWMAAARTELGDTPNPNRDRLTTLEWADKVRQNISDTHTLPWQDYDPSYESTEPHGTAHFSIIDEHGMAVAMTTTVNLGFGAQLADPVTGIVLNSEMDDFSLPDTNNAYELRPSVYNFVSPFKRPLSSTVPTIISSPDGRPEFVIGAAGGSRIVTAVFQAIIRTYDYNMPLLHTIAFPRLHHQLLPETAYLEYGAPLCAAHSLESKGHNVEFTTPFTAMNGILRKDGFLHAVCDYWRKRGAADGY